MPSGTVLRSTCWCAALVLGACGGGAGDPVPQHPARECYLRTGDPDLFGPGCLADTAAMIAVGS